MLREFYKSEERILRIANDDPKTNSWSEDHSFLIPKMILFDAVRHFRALKFYRFLPRLVLFIDYARSLVLLGFVGVYLQALGFTRACSPSEIYAVLCDYWRWTSSDFVRLSQGRLVDERLVGKQVGRKKVGHTGVVGSVAGRILGAGKFSKTSAVTAGESVNSSLNKLDSKERLSPKNSKELKDQKNDAAKSKEPDSKKTKKSVPQLPEDRFHIASRKSRFKKARKHYVDLSIAGMLSFQIRWKCMEVIKDKLEFYVCHPFQKKFKKDVIDKIDWEKISFLRFIRSLMALSLFWIVLELCKIEESGLGFTDDDFSAEYIEEAENDDFFGVSSLPLPTSNALHLLHKLSQLPILFMFPWWAGNRKILFRNTENKHYSRKLILYYHPIIHILLSLAIGDQVHFLKVPIEMVIILLCLFCLLFSWNILVDRAGREYFVFLTEADIEEHMDETEVFPELEVLQQQQDTTGKPAAKEQKVTLGNIDFKQQIQMDFQVLKGTVFDRVSPTFQKFFGKKNEAVENQAEISGSMNNSRGASNVRKVGSVHSEESTSSPIKTSRSIQVMDGNTSANFASMKRVMENNTTSQSLALKRASLPGVVSGQSRASHNNMESGTTNKQTQGRNSRHSTNSASEALNDLRNSRRQNTTLGNSSIFVTSVTTTNYAKNEATGSTSALGGSVAVTGNRKSLVVCQDQKDFKSSPITSDTESGQLENDIASKKRGNTSSANKSSMNTITTIGTTNNTLNLMPPGPPDGMSILPLQSNLSSLVMSFSNVNPELNRSDSKMNNNTQDSNDNHEYNPVSVTSQNERTRESKLSSVDEMHKIYEDAAVQENSTVGMNTINPDRKLLNGPEFIANAAAMKEEEPLSGKGTESLTKEESRPEEDIKPKEEEIKPKEEETPEEEIKPDSEDIKPKEEEIKPKEEEIKPKEEEIKPKEEEIKPKEEEIKPKEEKIKPKEEEIKPKEEETTKEEIKSKEEETPEEEIKPKEEEIKVKEEGTPKEEIKPKEEAQTNNPTTPKPTTKSPKLNLKPVQATSINVKPPKPPPHVLNDPHFDKNKFKTCYKRARREAVQAAHPEKLVKWLLREGGPVMLAYREDEKRREEKKACDQNALLGVPFGVDDEVMSSVTTPRIKQVTATNLPKQKKPLSQIQEQTGPRIPSPPLHTAQTRHIQPLSPHTPLKSRWQKRLYPIAHSQIYSQSEPQSCLLWNQTKSCLSTRDRLVASLPPKKYSSYSQH